MKNLDSEDRNNQSIHNKPKHKAITFLLFSLFIATIIGFSIQSSNAATVYARTNGTWTNTATWSTIGPLGPSCSCVPGMVDSVVIDGWAVNVVSPGMMASAVLVRNSNPGNTSLTVQNGVTLNVMGNVWVESQNQSNHVDLYIQDNNTILQVMGKLTFTRISSNSQVDRLRLQLLNGAQVNVAGNFNYYYQNAGTNENNTEIDIQDASELNVSGNMLIEVTNGKNFNLEMSDNAILDITGSLTTTLNGGSDLELALSDVASITVDGSYYANQNGGVDHITKLGLGSSGSTASFTVNGNLEMDHNGNAAGENMGIELHENTSLSVSGDILMDSDATSSDKVYIEANDNAVIHAQQDIQPVAVWQGIVFVELNDNALLNLEGDLIRQAWPNFYGSLTCTGNSTVRFIGSSQQQFPGEVGSGGDGVTLQNVVINNTTPSAPQMVMEDFSSVNGNIDFQNGILKLGAHNLTLWFNATTTSASPSSFVDASLMNGGYVRKMYNALTSFEYPVGDDDDFTPFKVTLNSGTVFMGGIDYIMVAVEDAMHPAITDPTYISRYWSVDSDGFIAINYDVEYKYTDADIVGDESRLLASRFQGFWEDHDPVNVVTNNMFSTVGITSHPHRDDFSSAMGTVLPIELLSFEGVEVNNMVLLKWTTSVEINNELFRVQRSVDGTMFKEIGQLAGAGNSYSPVDYELTDETPFWGVSYYRLVQRDHDGTETATQVIAVRFTGSRNKTAKVYPNPLKQGEVLNMEVDELPNKEVLVVMLDHLGREVYSKVALTEQDGVLTGICSSNDLSPGVYFIVASSENDVFKQKVVITGCSSGPSLVMK